MIEFYNALGQAYGLAVVSANRPGAVALLRDSIKEDPTLRDDAEKARAQFAAVVAARSQGGSCGCFVSKTNLDLLTEALAEEG